MDRQPDWYLREWMAYFGFKKQADLMRELGWEKSRAHHMWHNKQAYRREDVNAVAAWLELAPFELLMPPRDALALRRLRESAAVIAGEGGSLQVAERPQDWDAKSPGERIADLKRSRRA